MKTVLGIVSRFWSVKYLPDVTTVTHVASYVCMYNEDLLTVVSRAIYDEDDEDDAGDDGDDYDYDDDDDDGRRHIDYIFFFFMGAFRGGRKEFASQTKQKCCG